MSRGGGDAAPKSGVAAEEPAILRAEALSIGYASPLLRPVDFALRPGELVVVLGPNGSGKSTLLRCLAGLQKPLGGKVVLGRREIARWPIRERARRLALVPPGRARVPLLVADLVALGRTPYTGWSGRLSARDAAVVDEALAIAGVDALRDRPCSTLSDGEAQRTEIARCLAQEAEILLLDEPTAHLDAPARVEVMALLQGLTRRSHRPRAVLVTLHEMDLALRTADRLWLLGGDELRVGAPEDLVLDGSIDRVFARRDLVFDPVDAAFRPPPGSATAVRVEGEGLAGIWTRRAVRRLGLRPVEDDGTEAAAETALEAQPTLRVSVGPDPARPPAPSSAAADTAAGSPSPTRWTWRLETDAGSTQHRTIADLAEALQTAVRADPHRP